MHCLASKKIDAPFTRWTSKLKIWLVGDTITADVLIKKWGEFFDGVDDVVPLNAINKSNKDKETQCGENICVRLVDQPSWLQSYSWEEIKTAQEIQGARE